MWVVEQPVLLGRGGEQVLVHLVRLGEDDAGLPEGIAQGQLGACGPCLFGEVPLVYLGLDERVLGRVAHPVQPMGKTTGAAEEGRASRRVGVVVVVGRTVLERNVDPRLRQVGVAQTEAGAELLEEIGSALAERWCLGRGVSGPWR